MKKFNWEEFLNTNNKIAVHCKTEEEAKDFCRQMHEHGMKWCTNDPFLENTEYERYADETCYVATGKFRGRNYYESNAYTILEWSDYMKTGNKEFTKADLKDGMVVEYRKGRKRLVVNGWLIGIDGHCGLKHFEENLMNLSCSDRDIVKVFKIKECVVLEHIFDEDCLELIWERKEVKKMTVEEMRAKLEELTGEKIAIINE